MLTIQELISIKTDILDNAKVKLVRHQDHRIEYQDLIKDRERLIET